MPVDLKQKEEALKLLLRKVDAELAEFEKLTGRVEVKRTNLEKSAHAVGMQPVPVDIGPNSGNGGNLEDELKRHVLELNKLKNFINVKLNRVIREEELLEKLKAEYGKSVGIMQLPGGEFELTFSDAATKEAFKKLQNGRKTFANVKEAVKGIVEQ